MGVGKVDCKLLFEYYLRKGPWRCKVEFEARGLRHLFGHDLTTWDTDLCDSLFIGLSEDGRGTFARDSATYHDNNSIPGKRRGVNRVGFESLSSTIQ